MPQKKNTLLRVLVPLLLIAAGVGVSIAVWVNTGNQGRQRQQPPLAAAPAPGDTAPDAPATQPALPEGLRTAGAAPDLESPEPPAAEPAPPAAPPPPGLRALVHEGAEFDPAPLGGSEAHALEVRFSPVGAGIAAIELTNYYKTIKREQPVALVSERSFGAGRLTPMALLGLQVGETYVPLTGYTPAGEPLPIWTETAPGAFEATIVDAEGAPVLRVSRAFTLEVDSYELTVDQRVENLTDAPLAVRIIQTGPADLMQESFYGGDKRRFRFGYLLDPQRDPTQQFVQPDADLIPRSELLGKRLKPSRLFEPTRQLWPTPAHAQRGHTLSWIALTNRYFAVAVHPNVDPDAPVNDLRLHAAETIDRVLADTASGEGIMLRMTGPRRVIEAGEPLDASLRVYAGPLSRRVINDQAQARVVGLDGLVVYNFGGMCAFCTFAWLADGLKAILLFAHDYITHDWALAIILLVLIVRTILHPVTRWSQIRMQRFAKQMQEVGPKQKKLQEKFKDDPKRLQQETAKLWREEGVSPAGMLGCLPMLLQTPVWIALYAVLYFSFEMRHQPAFFGVFQQFGNWAFLADLAQPDRFIAIANPIDLFGLMRIDGLNVLPILLGVVFYAHQKYLTPPTTTTMTPEQEQQQKIIKVMMVVLFPLLMYGAPSGLAIYFITNSTIAIIENRHIRKAIDAKGLLDVKKRTPTKRGGFLGRLYEIAEQQQRLREQGQIGPGRDQRKAMQRASRGKPGGDLPRPRGKKRP